MNDIIEKFKAPDFKPDENTKSELERLNREGESLSGFQLEYADLKNANLVDADLSSCDLTRADLSHTSMYGANLEGANLFKANLEGANLKDSNLTNCELLGANFTNSKLHKVNWGEEGKITNELEAEKSQDALKAKSKYKEAEEIYCAVRLTMQGQSLGEEASKVFIREMVCKRKQYPKLSFFRIMSKIAHITTGYGENIKRIIGSIFYVLFISAVLFGIEGVSYQDRTLGFFVDDLQNYGIWNTFGNLFYFSVITFTTVGFGEITPIGPIGKFLTIFEGLISGIILTILIVAIYRRMMDR
jgi:hypothetical protein|tara:strand:- start:29 stop:931 length:903 start_codon:yes stop_codon:yes gene_type:complete